MAAPTGSCPRCGSGSPLEGETGTRRCAQCGGLWALEETLRSCIRAFISVHGQDDAVIALHETPSAQRATGCPDCGRRLDAVRLRSVEVERCRPCARVFLSTKDIETISERVLASAQSLKGVVPSRLPNLDAMLRDPDRFDIDIPG